MTEYTDTTIKTGNSNDESATPSSRRRRGRPATAAATPPKAKAKTTAAKPPAKPKAVAKPPVQRTPNAAAVRPILKQMAEMNAAGTMTPEIAAAALEFCIVLLGDDLNG